MLATIQKLEEELENYKGRIKFLKEYIEHLTKHTVDAQGKKVYNSLDDVDKAYRLQNELDFKNSLIDQRKAQIKQINEQEQLKQKAIKELPELIEKSKEVHDMMLDDLHKLKRSKKTKEPTKNKGEDKWLNGLVVNVRKNLVSLQVKWMKGCVLSV